MRVQAQGRGHNGKKFRETCETLVVNGYGGLLLLKHEIDNGEMLVITNPETLEEQECRVVYLGEPGDKQRVGVEFLTPAPRFWGVEFVETHPQTTLQPFTETLEAATRAGAWLLRLKNQSPNLHRRRIPTSAP